MFMGDLLKEKIGQLPWKERRWTISGILLAIMFGLTLLSSGGQAILLNAGMVSVVHELWGESSLLDSREVLSASLDLNPDEKEAWRGLGYFWLISGDQDLALESWKRAGITARDLVLQGEAERRKDQFEEALTWFNLAAELDPDWGDAFFYLGWMHARAGDQVLAWRYLRKAENLPLELVGRSDIYYQLGKVENRLWSGEQQPSALDYFTRAIVRNQFKYPYQSIDAHFQRGLLYRQNGWNEMALNELTYVIKKHPDHYPALVRLGYMAWEVEDDLGKAEGYFSVAIQVDSRQTAAYLGFAHVLEEAGQLTRAQEMYRKVLEIDASNQKAHDALERLED